MVTMTHQTLSLEKYWKLLPATLRDKPDVIEIIDVFTCEDIISSHLRISYRFYQFVTTRYTTDYYIIKRHNLRSLYNILRKIEKTKHCLLMYPSIEDKIT